MFGSFERDRSIRVRVLSVLALVTLVSIGTMAVVSYRLGVRTLEQQAIDQLTAARELKGQQIEDYFQTIRDQLVTLSEDRMVVAALREFSAATATLEQELAARQLSAPDVEREVRVHYQNEFYPRLEASVDDPGPLSRYWPEDPVALSLQHLYIGDNPYALDFKHLLDASDAGTRYDEAHARYHPLLRQFLERFGYYDLFLVSATDLRIVYSVFKEVDFGTSLSAGPHRQSSLADVSAAAMGFPAASDARLVDFRPYLPSYGAPASFIASPVVEEGEVLGALVFQMPLSRINETMTSGGAWRSVGFGETGEAYLVGPDETLRTESRFLIEEREGYLAAIRAAGIDETVVRSIEAQESAVGLQPARTEGVSRALAGETGESRFRDYRDVEVFSAFRPLDIQDLNWVIMSEIDVAEAMSAVGTLGRRMAVALVVLIPLLALLAYWFSGNLVRPIQALSVTANALAGGELDQPVDMNRGDEVGDLARSFESMRVSLRDLIDRQNRSIEALSTPLIPIHDDVVVLPLVGELDRSRCQRIRDSLTHRLHERGDRCVIVDLTGVSRLDPEVADELALVAQAARLMGAKVILSGLRPQLAADLADHPETMSGIATARSLRDAIEVATGEAD
ncbi:MAG: HAMP domain-containing protein [Gemmatimonadales bacterium]|jgi:methyl-accepting chemotaxis protein|nr:MAG: HAMP domain-containing protein [Gemmatimonadales bacterium]